MAKWLRGKVVKLKNMGSNPARVILFHSFVELQGFQRGKGEGEREVVQQSSAENLCKK